MQPLKKVVDTADQKMLDEKSMFEITGKTQKLDHLKPPYFPVAEKQEVELTPFKKRMLELWKGKK